MNIHAVHLVCGMYSIKQAHLVEGGKKPLTVSIVLLDMTAAGVWMEVLEWNHCITGSSEVNVKPKGTWCWGWYKAASRQCLSHLHMQTARSKTKWSNGITPVTQMYAVIENCTLWSICSFADSLGGRMCTRKGLIVEMIRTLIALNAGKKKARVISSRFVFSFLNVMIYPLI